jgi:hypothetical protein
MINEEYVKPEEFIKIYESANATYSVVNLS